MLEFKITYLACQSCTVKIHCDRCGDDLAQRLEQQKGVHDVSIDISNRRIALQAEGWEEADLLDLMEDMGLFAD